MSWRTVPTPASAEIVRFATPLLGFAGAGGSSCPKRSQLWRTTDAGASWSPLPGTCGPDFVDIDIVTPSLLVTAQTYGYDGRANVIRRTGDGGATWQTLHRDGRVGWRSLERVAFDDATHGWAVSHESGQGFCSDALHVTSDGGRTWRSRTFPIRPSAISGRSALGGDETGAVVWRTTDQGRTWYPSVRPRHVGAVLRYATGTTAVVATNVGTVRVGPHLAVRPRPSASDEAARVLGKVAYLQLDRDLEGVPMIRQDGGRSWRRLGGPRPWTTFGDVAFVDPRRGLIAAGDVLEGGALPVYATRDAGRTWRRVRVPPSVQRGAPAVLAPGIVFLPSGIDPPRYTIAFLSDDEGRHWRSTRLTGGSAWSCHGAAGGASIWIACAGEQSLQRTVLLVSPDHGHSWSKVRARRYLDAVVPVSARKAWATSGGALWHTTDGARTWRRVWLRVPTSLRAFSSVPVGYRC